MDEKTKETIIDITAGHSKLTLLAVRGILNHESRIMNQEEMRKLVQHDKGVTKALEDIWQSFNPAEQTHFLKRLFPSVLDDEHSQYLKHVGMMTDDAFTMPLFKTFTFEKGQQKNPSSITFNPETNTILQADQKLSDTLTGTEFRLLKYFLENSETILERNTIIQNVWKENKTVLGVTDQALDQLIFRLRRKIEEDPNSPTHLLTIKGRGFRFVP